MTDVANPISCHQDRDDHQRYQGQDDHQRHQGQDDHQRHQGQAIIGLAAVALFAILLIAGGPFYNGTHAHRGTLATAESIHKGAFEAESIHKGAFEAESIHKGAFAHKGTTLI